MKQSWFDSWWVGGLLMALLAVCFGVLIYYLAVTDNSTSLTIKAPECIRAWAPGEANAVRVDVSRCRN